MKTETAADLFPPMQPSPPGRKRFRIWMLRVLLLLPALALFAWSGSNNDPRSAIAYTFTKTGWLAPNPGLTCFWISAALLFWLLCEIAWLLFDPLANSKKLKPWASAGIILTLALLTRLAIARTWTALPLDPVLLAAKSPASPGGWRYLAVSGDLVLIALLLLTLAGSRRSLWWAALYALHPLVLFEVAGNSSLLPLYLVPLILLLALKHRLPLPSPKQIPGCAATAGLAVLLAALAAGGTYFQVARLAPFNSLPAFIASSLDLPPTVLLPALTFFLELFIVAIALRNRWPLARALSHFVLAMILTAPHVDPALAIILLALLPLAWDRAAWVLSLTILLAYAAVPALKATQHFAVPDSILMLEWIPVVIVELQELLATATGPRGNRFELFRRSASAAPVSPVP